MRKLLVLLLGLMLAVDAWAQVPKGFVPFAQKENKDRIDTLQYYGNRLDLEGRQSDAIDYYLDAVKLLIEKKEFYSKRFWKVSLSLALDAQQLYGDSLSLDIEERLLYFIDYPIPIKNNEPFLHNLSNAQTCAFFLGDYDKAIFYGHWYLNQMEMTEPFDKDEYSKYCLTLASYYRLANRSITECCNFLLNCCKRYLEITGTYPIEFEDKFLEMDVESRDYIQASRRIKDLYEFYKNNLDVDSSYSNRFVNVLLKAGNIYSSFNQNLQAYVCLSELSEFLDSNNIEDGKIYYEMFCNLGMVYLQCNLYDDAISCFDKALGYRNDVPDFYDVDVHCNINLALCYESKNDYFKALEYSQKAYNCSFSSKAPNPEIVQLRSKIMYYLYRAYCGSVADYDDLVGLAGMFENHSNLELFELFVVSLAKVSPKFNFDNINNDLLNLLYRIQIDKVRYNLFLTPEEEKYQSVLTYIPFNDLLFTLHQTEVDKNNDLLVNLCLALKGGALNSIRQLGKTVENSNDTVLVNQYHRVKTLKSLHSHYIVTSKASADSVHYLLYQAEFELMDRLCRSDSVYLSNYKWKEVAKCLSKNEMAVEFFDYVKIGTDLQNEDGRTYVALVFKKGWKQPKFLELFNDTIFRKEFSGKIMSIHSSSLSPMIREKILDPILALAKKGDRIFYSPTGIIHNISLENLYDKEGQPAYINYDLRRVSSTSEISFTDKCNLKSILLFGDIAYTLSDEQMIEQSHKFVNYSDNVSRAFFDDSTRAEFRPIPGTKTEVDNIDKELSSKCIDVKKQTGSLASEEAFKVLSTKGYDIIHLATHGFFLKDSASIKRNMLIGKLDDNTISRNPLLRSGLALAGANRAWNGERIPNGVDDGILTAQEIKDLDLSKTQMVVLSACETGLGDINTDGVFGLQRAFKSAGVQTIVMSLWKVSDNATSLLMTEFYKGLLATGDRHKAFLQAKEAVRARFPEAYYWAGFVMLD